MRPSTAWALAIGALAKAAAEVSVDDVGMNAAGDDDLRQWVSDLEDRIGLDVSEFRPAVEQFIDARAAAFAEVQSHQ